MSKFAWPASWGVQAFQMRVVPNVRAFRGPYTPTVQTIDLLGEVWLMSFDLPPGNDPIVAGEREAFFDRLLGPVNLIELWNLQRPVPLGTITSGGTVSVVNTALQPVQVVNSALQPVTVASRTPQTTSAAAKGADTVPIRNEPGRTLEPGDMLGLGGQLVRVVTRAVFDANGVATVQFLPRLRKALPALTDVVINKPTAQFELRGEGVPVVHRPRMYEGSALELIERI
jgi:hypothetical protein